MVLSAVEVKEFGIFRKKREYDVPMSISPASGYSKTSKSSNGGKSVISKKAKASQEMKDLEPIEIILRTYVIRDEMKLKLLMKLLKEVDACGITLEGQNLGRHGVVSWLIVTSGKTLIPIDMDMLSEKMPNLWKLLEKDLFCNVKLVKIMHDSRPAADYLLHAHGIRMVNVFDTQVADALINYETTKCTPSQLSSLADCLEMYNRRIPVEEYEFLRKYENYDFSTNSPMLKKPLPPPEFLKLCALKVKHLVPLRENMMKKFLEKMTRCTEAHMDSYRAKSRDEYSTMSKVSPREFARFLKHSVVNANCFVCFPLL